MGLRFRRSVKICNGLRVNFGKTGASLTVGSGPVKKTFHTNGNTTTTVSLPGTGIYWTETERPGSRRNVENGIQPQRQDKEIQRSYPDFEEVEEEYNVLFPEETVPDTNIIPENNFSEGLSMTDIKNLYYYADIPVEWTELISGTPSDELLMNPETYAYCVKKASGVLSGDIDTYLEVIEKMRPVDDLALYSGDFEYGTDAPNYIEVEFTAYPERVLLQGTEDDLLKEFISAITIRTARDLYALLPVSKILVHVEVKNNTILSVLFERNKLCQINFKGMDAIDIIDEFKHLVFENHLHDVGRLSI